MSIAYRICLMKIPLFPHSYKQQKFNLFREESEGYSKLLAELVIDGCVWSHQKLFWITSQSLIWLAPGADNE